MQNNETGNAPITLSEAEQQQAKELLAQHPKLGVAIVECQNSVLSANDKLRTMIRELHGASLLPKEQTLVLAAAGFNRQRISEIKAVVNQLAPQVEEYLAGGEGFRVALRSARAARGSLPSPTSGMGEALSKLCVAFVNQPAIKICLPAKKVQWAGEVLDCRVVISFSPKKVRKAAVAPKTKGKKGKKTTAQKKLGKGK